jgi:hypothetical protein
VSGGIEERVAELEQRVRALEEAGGSQLASVLAYLGANEAGGGGAQAEPAEAAGGPTAQHGAVSYKGAVNFGGPVAWSIRYDAGAAAELPQQPLTEVLAALGHPVRLQLAHALLSGPATAAELQESLGLHTPGQLYHHLRALTAAKVIAQPSRNQYVLPAEKVVPVLVLTLAAGDIAGLL